jgi:hypothetical protein
MRGLAIGLVLALVACAGAREFNADRAYEAGVAAVERLDVSVRRERPVAVDVSVTGQLPDACTLIHRVHQERRVTGIEVTLTTRREAGARCPAGPRPFQRMLSLDVHGLPAGLYFVSVNGVSTTFQIFDDSAVREPLDRYQTW